MSYPRNCIVLRRLPWFETISSRSTLTATLQNPCKYMKTWVQRLRKRRSTGWQQLCTNYDAFQRWGELVSTRTVVRVLRNSLLFLPLVVIADNGVRPAFAQDAINRKVKSRVSPTYPEIARKMGLTGTVKFRLTVASNGTVKETKVIGGHPILVNAAMDAVKKWKFETASAETTGTVEIRFNPGD